jgi:hypothetical protein
MLRRILLPSTAVVLLVAGVWYLSQANDETADVRRRLQALCDDVNSSTTDGRGPEARAGQLGLFFTDDVDVDLGNGAMPIKGRPTVVAMAARLQPRTAAFKLEFADVTVVMEPGGQSANVHLTAEFIRRNLSTGEQTLDAREFTLGMRRVANDWQIQRVTAVDTLK